MDYMYGQLYKQIKEIEYKGRNSETTIITVDQKTRTIRVDVKILSPEQLPKDEGNYVLLVEIDENGKHTLKWVSTQSTLDRIKELEDKTYKLTYNKDTDTSTFDSNVTINKDLNVEGIATIEKGAEISEYLSVPNGSIWAGGEIKANYANPAVSLKPFDDRAGIRFSDNTSTDNYVDIVHYGSPTGRNELLVPDKSGTLSTVEDIAAELENYYTKTESDAKYSQATNIENGTGTGSLKQKDPTYDGLVDALKPYNRSYLKSKGYTSSNPTTAKSILVASGLYSSDEAENYITNNGSEPEVIAEALAKGQLKGYHNIEPDTDLSNTVTEAAASSFVMGIQNKAYSPLMFVGGMNCEAGSKNSSSYLISSFTFGRELKNYSLDSIMAGLGTNSYKVIKNQNNAYKGQQRCYLKYLAEAGGQVTGEGDNRVAVTGVNDGPSCVVLGNYHFSKGECNVLLGNQNIINGGDNVAIGLHNYIIGYVHLSACIGVQNVIKGTGSYDCYGNYLIGRSLRLEGGKHRVAVGVSNAKADDASVIFMVGNGDEDASSSETQRRSNAFEVLKDGRAKVKSAPTENDDVVRLQELNAVEQGNYSDITNIDLNTGDTTVEYDTGLGITVNAKGTVIHENGATEQPTTKFELPIIAGAGIVIDKAEGEEKIVIRAVFGDDIRVLVIDETAVFLKGATVSGKSAVFVSGAAVVNNQIIF